MGFQQVLRDIKQGKTAPVYLVLGEDLPKRKQVLTALRKAVCDGDVNDWNYQEVDGQTVTGGQVVAMAHTQPFFGDRRLLVIRSFELMPLAEQEQLLEVVDDPPACSILALVATELDKRTRSGKKLLANAVLLDVSAPKREHLNHWVVSLASSKGLSMALKSAALLVESAGADTGFLANEVEKLAVYLDSSPDSTKVVDQETILFLAARGGQDLVAFAGLRFAEAVAEGKADDALQQLDELFSAGEPALKTLGVLAYQYRLLLGAKAFADFGPAEAAKAMGVSAYPLKRAFALAQRLQREDVENGMEMILQSDIALKRGADGKTTLQMLVVKLAKRKTPGVGDGR